MAGSLICYLIVMILASTIVAESDTEEVKIDVIWKPDACSRTVKTGDFVRYHYYGLLENGQYFDSSFERGSTYDTYIGKGWLIPGMDQGLMGMCINEHRLITIPPRLAYGAKGSGLIPGNATIIFNTILLDIWNDADTIQVTTTFAPAECDRKLESSDYVRYHYNGTLLNGKPFHSSYDERKTYDAYVGKGWLVKGMDAGLVGACFGERRIITIPPHLGYGAAGDGKKIPRSATIVFDVVVVDFHNPRDRPVVAVTAAVADCDRRLNATDFVRYHYNGTLADGSLFDSSYQRNRTYDTYVGHRRLIPGMEEGLLGACMGERRSVLLPPHLAYGEAGVEGVIPPSAVLKFDVHVVDFHNPADDARITVLHLPDDAAEGVRTAAPGDFVNYEFEMRLMDGTLLDSSSNAGSYLGREHLIPGAERGLAGMVAGEIRRVIVPPHIGYGEFGRADYVPGSAVLDFNFKLLAIHDGMEEGRRMEWSGSPPPDLTLSALDSDLDGKIDPAEFKAFVTGAVEAGAARLAPHKPPDAVVADAFESLDSDDDGFVSEAELEWSWADPTLPSVKLDDEL